MKQYTCTAQLGDHGLDKEVMGIVKDVMTRGRRTWRLESEWIILGLAFTSCMMVALSLVLFYSELNKEEEEQPEHFMSECEREVDVVITWVNGSDISFTEDLVKHYRIFQAARSGRSEGASSKEIDPKRFLDSEELRFCLRSLEKFAPWVRMVYIVTNGQVPHWLDSDHPQIKVVR